MTTNHTIEALLAEGARILAPASDTSRLDAELLLAHALNVGRTWLTAHATETVQGDRYQAFIGRRATGEPLAYILGFKDFWTLRLSVTPAVLVPRPETELLVELALLNPLQTANAVDLGTGSGAIALALASERPNWRVAATDASAAALEVARANSVQLDLARIELLQGSWFEPLGERRFDVILSNPPYIAANDPVLEHPTLKNEPYMALSPGRDSLAALREIIRGAPHHLERHGWLLLEHGADQAVDVARELVAHGFTNVRSHRDLAGHERVTEARWS